MIRLRLLSVLLLSLALVAASLTVAMARGQAAASHQVVICTGLGVTTLLVDARGRPAGPVHPCPDCLAGLMAVALSDAPALPVAPAPQGTALRLALPQRAAGASARAPCARDPPAGLA